VGGKSPKCVQKRKTAQNCHLPVTNSLNLILQLSINHYH
jgi:hypothetical protein